MSYPEQAQQDNPEDIPRPAMFSGREWLRVLVSEYGEDLRGLSLAELAMLPETDWQQAPSLKVELRRNLGKQAVGHPDEPGFSFSELPDFFDGVAYTQSLIATYGENLERLSGHAILNLPQLKRPTNDTMEFIGNEPIRPFERVDLDRLAYEFAHMTPISFPEF